MAKNTLSELREEWYSESDHQPETVEDEIDDELLELEVLFRSRGTVMSGNNSVKITDEGNDPPDSEADDQ